MAKYLTQISFGEWKEGDVVLFPKKPGGGIPYWDTVCNVEGGKLIDVSTSNEVTPEEAWECHRLDYKFISDGTWYVEGTEAYILSEPWGDDHNGRAGMFAGWTNEDFTGFDGDLPRWDEESCTFEEFVITKR
jgi:hypothetical protein